MKQTLIDIGAVILAILFLVGFIVLYQIIPINYI